MYSQRSSDRGMTIMTTGENAVLRRFLLTGSETGVYKAGSGGDLHIDAAPNFLRELTAAGPAVVDDILQPGNNTDAALFALAAAASPRFAGKETNAKALAALPLVAAKARDLVVFANYAGAMRGWGRGMRTAVSNWYEQQPPSHLAAQILRRPGKLLRDHRAILRRAHPKAGTLAQNAMYQWISDGQLGHLATSEIRQTGLRQAYGFELAKRAESTADILRLIEDYKLKPALVPARWKSSAAVWEALFDHLSYRQILRYLGALTQTGLLARGASEYSALAVARLADRRRIAAAGIHPLRIASAMRRYRLAGHAIESIFDALEEALHLAAEYATPRIYGKRLLVALDATGSMQGATVSGMPETPAALAAVTLALSLVRASDRAEVVAFDQEVRNLDFSRGVRLAEALNQVGAKPSRSDVTAPLREAAWNRTRFDAIVIITDKLPRRSGLVDSWKMYQDAAGHPAKLLLLQLSSRDLSGWEATAATDPDAIAFAGLDHHQSTQTLHHFLSR
ncbi:60 kDa SS-A/Ro ribonucleoprotein [Bryobacterales bacterium F-183]|nr:60 kDa SS-A/Ro ribonucleoprotein [Bryobacterales bacterium F-183]